MVPLYDVPIMPTLPVVHVGSGASTLPVCVVYAFARPFSQSMIAVAPSDSLRAPDVGQPVDQPVPGDSECTTPKPRGSHVASKSLLMNWELTPVSRLVSRGLQNGANARAGGCAPSSCATFQLL